MNEQKIPGVQDARLPSITAKTYGILTTVAVVSCAAAILVVTHLPGDRTVDVINIDSTRHVSQVVLIAGDL